LESTGQDPDLLTRGLNLSRQCLALFGKLPFQLRVRFLKIPILVFDAEWLDLFGMCDTRSLDTLVLLYYVWITVRLSRSTAIRFETADGKVNLFYLGGPKQVQYVEGCM
jgi:hypothetical protein